MEFDLELMGDFEDQLKQGCFNPCCSGIWFRIQQGQNKETLPYFVSILVVVEFDLELIDQMDEIITPVSFNPCCSGIWFRIFNDMSMAGNSLEFQSLL